MILVFYLIQQSFVQIYIHHLEKQLVVKKILATQKKVLIRLISGIDTKQSESPWRI